MKVYSDVSYNFDINDMIYIGLVVIDNSKVSHYTAKLDRYHYGSEIKNPEDVGILLAKEHFPAAHVYYTDSSSSKHGKYVKRRHKHIQKCHKLANKARLKHYHEVGVGTLYFKDHKTNE